MSQGWISKDSYPWHHAEPRIGAVPAISIHMQNEVRLPEHDYQHFIRDWGTFPEILREGSWLKKSSPKYRWSTDPMSLVPLAPYRLQRPWLLIPFINPPTSPIGKFIDMRWLVLLHVHVVAWTLCYVHWLAVTTLQPFPSLLAKPYPDSFCIVLELPMIWLK